MEQNNQSYKTILGPEIQKEISMFPLELFKKKKEIDCLKKDVATIITNLNASQEKLNNYMNDIVSDEKLLYEILSKKNSLKTKQKLILSSINQDIFSYYKSMFFKIHKDIFEILVSFFDFQKNYTTELNLIIKNKEQLIELFSNSYSNIKMLYKINSDKYNAIKKKIFGSTIDEENMYEIKKENVVYPFTIFLEYIENCFNIIKLKEKSKIINESITPKKDVKNSIFINMVILNKSKQEKEQKIDLLKIYIKYLNMIMDKYKQLKNKEKLGAESEEDIKISNEIFNSIKNLQDINDLQGISHKDKQKDTDKEILKKLKLIPNSANSLKNSKEIKIKKTKNSAIHAPNKKDKKNMTNRTLFTSFEQNQTSTDISELNNTLKKSKVIKKNKDKNIILISDDINKIKSVFKSTEDFEKTTKGKKFAKKNFVENKKKPGSPTKILLTNHISINNLKYSRDDFPKNKNEHNNKGKDKKNVVKTEAEENHSDIIIDNEEDDYDENKFFSLKSE